MKQLLLLVILCVTFTHAKHYGDYPDSLMLYERDSDYINKQRPVIDVEYFFDRKIVDTTKTTISDDYEPITYKWLYIHTDGDKIAKCVVDSLTYEKYTTGDTIGAELTHKKVQEQVKVKEATTHQTAQGLPDEAIVFLFIVGILAIVFIVAMIICI